MRQLLVRALLVALMGTGLTGMAPLSSASAMDSYTPRNGIWFNNPYGTDASRRFIIHRLLRTIDSVHRGQSINISAWNVRSYNITRSLLRAKRRGVVVRVVMDRVNWNAEVPNVDARTLARGLRVGNKKLPPEKRSWLRRCYSSCRGRSGIPHSKFYLFSKVNGVKNVVMFGSNNATELAANIQWNDLYVRVRRPVLYETFLQVFQQMAKDQPVAQPYVTVKDGAMQAEFYPYKGVGAVGDPVMNILNQVKCTGVTGGAGHNGRTVIRIAQTSTYGPRGDLISKRLAALQHQGCDIRIVYAMFGNGVLKTLRAAGVPLTHLAYDSNQDGIYDKYIHMKDMTISGNYAGRTDARMTWNGSANWTGVALHSDEVVGTIDSAKVELRYRNWINYLFTHRPVAWGTAPRSMSTEQLAKMRGVDPYALIRKEQ